MRRKFLMAGGGVLTVILLGSHSGWAADNATHVTIDNFTFTPAEITVAKGATVTWENQDDIPHTVVDAADPRSFKSAPLDTGDKFSHVFAAPGVYHYFCSLHPHMQGTVVVK